MIDQMRHQGLEGISVGSCVSVPMERLFLRGTVIDITQCPERYIVQLWAIDLELLPQDNPAYRGLNVVSVSPRELADAMMIGR